MSDSREGPGGGGLAAIITVIDGGERKKWQEKGDNQAFSQ